MPCYMGSSVIVTAIADKLLEQALGKNLLTVLRQSVPHNICSELYSDYSAVMNKLLNFVRTHNS